MSTPQRAKARKKETAAPAPAKPRPVRNIVIRAAVPRDATALYDVLIRYFEELALFYPGPVEGPTMAWGLSVLVKGGVIVATENDQIIGSVGMEMGQYPWAPAVNYLNGVWFYVAPEYRRGGTAERLMKAAKDIAERNKMALRLDNVWGVEVELQDRWRKQHGFKYVGGNHVWFPETGG